MKRILQDFLIDFDNYHSTHSSENQYFSQKNLHHTQAKWLYFLPKMWNSCLILKRAFFWDRFVKGTCPECDAPNQYGDNCEVCSSTYNATELKNLIQHSQTHHPSFDHLSTIFSIYRSLMNFLRTWTKSQGRLQSSIYNKLSEWFDAGLAPWDISRDAPYFGFKIPDTPADEPDKYFLCLARCPCWLYGKL